MNIIIPLNGIGKRFTDLGYLNHKPLIKIFEKELILEVLDRFIFNKDNIKLIIIYNENLDKFNFKDTILDKYPGTLFISLKMFTDGPVQTVIEGLSKLNKEEIYNKTLFIDCDTFYTINLIDLCNKDDNNKIFYRNNNNSKPLYSYILTDSKNKVMNIKEKIKISDNANTGAYFFNDINEYLKYAQIIINNNIKFNNEYYTSCLIDKMIENEIEFYGIEIPENTVYSIGTPSELETYKENTHLFLFDLDGTLVLTDDIYIEVWDKLLKKFNIFITKEIFRDFIQGNSDDVVLRRLLNITDKHMNEVISKNKDKLFLENLDRIKIIEGALDFLKELKINGQKIGIVTNCNRIVAENILKFTGIKNYIDILIIGNECKKSKPDSEPYLTAIKKMNFDIKKTLIFEDSKSGLKSAISTEPKLVIGIETSLSKSELLKFNINQCINDYKNLDFMSFIKSNNKEFKYIKKYISDSLRLDVNKIILDDEKLKGGYICEILSFEADIDDNIENMILKIENNEKNSVSDMANKLDLYNREYYFYESIRPELNVKIPRYYGILRDESLNSIGIIMENLFSKGMDQGIDLNKEPIEISLKIIDEMTKYHSKFWNKNLKSIFPLLNKHNSSQFNPLWSNFISENKDNFIEKWKDLLKEEDIELIHCISKNFSKIQNYLSTGDLTLCHGDVKAPNLFFDKSKFPYDPYFIDWQYIAIGKGTQDLIFFMIKSFDVVNIKVNFNIFTNYYYTKLIEKNIKYNYEQYQEDLLFSMCYFPFYVAIWFGTTNSDELIDKNFPFFFIKKLFLNYRYIGISKIIKTID